MYVVATAGHVDHGKSALVRALTGMEPDRWAEERRRGMTIDLGYVWTALPCGDVAFVDVPGHKRFIANMLAGLGPSPAVLFVVAADEGWRAQSEEHLRAVDALGIATGVLAVTRCDLADPSPARADAMVRLARSSLRAARAVAVSAVTGHGLDALREALSAALSEQPPPAVTGDARLWVDRAFTIGGSGTVVTGTLAGGPLRVGDEVEVAPSGARAHVRALETLKQRRDEVRPVARVAVNLRGVPATAVRRGHALVAPGAWRRTAVVDARLVAPDGTPPRELRLHVGSASVEVAARPLGADHVRLALRAPLPLRAGDRGVLHDPGGAGVVGGVLVLDADPPPLGAPGAAAARAAEVAAMTGTPDPAREVARRGVVAAAHLRSLGVDVAWRDVPGVVESGPWIVSAERWRAWAESAATLVDGYAAGNPLDPAMPVEHLRQELGVPDRHVVAGVLAQVPSLTVARGRVSRAGAGDARHAAAVEEVRRRLAAEPFRPPSKDELAGLGLADASLAAAVRDGLLVRIAPGTYLRPESVDLAVRRLGDLPAPFTAAEAREALGTTRRVVIPLLEHLDGTRRTKRHPDGRRDVRG